jgi:hypothetical protein
MMRIAVFTKNRTNPAYEAARLGASRVAATLRGADDRFRSADARRSPQRPVSGVNAVPARIELPVEIVDRDNCEAWDVPFEARPLPTLEEVSA